MRSAATAKSNALACASQIEHAPSAHASPGAQLLPQAPQFAVPGGTQVPEQTKEGGGHTHWPFAHAKPGSQAFPQPPQLAGPSASQCAPQSIGLDGGQVHAPATHVLSGPQLDSQEEVSAGSPDASTTESGSMAASAVGMAADSPASAS
jgi:hypothetical protein